VDRWGKGVRQKKKGSREIGTDLTVDDSNMKEKGKTQRMGDASKKGWLYKHWGTLFIRGGKGGNGGPGGNCGGGGSKVEKYGAGGPG